MAEFYREYLLRRWTEGCQVGRVLMGEIQTLCDVGSYAGLAKLLAPWRYDGHPACSSISQNGGHHCRTALNSALTHSRCKSKGDCGSKMLIIKDLPPQTVALEMVANTETPSTSQVPCLQ
jgi:hypothetical protein